MTENEGAKVTVEQSSLPTDPAEGTTSRVTMQKATEGTGDVPVVDSTAVPTQATSSKRTKKSKSSRKNT